MTSNHKKLILLIGVATSVLMMWWALRDTNVDQIMDALKKANYWLSIPLLLCYTAFFVLKAVRWRLIIKPMKVTDTKTLVAPMMLGFFGNNILPAHLGDFIRMYLGARALGLRSAQILGTLVLERVFDVLAIVLLFEIALIFGGFALPAVSSVHVIIEIAGIVLLLLLLSYVLWTPVFLKVVGGVLFFVPRHWREAVLHQMALSATGLATIRSPRLLVPIVLNSIVQWAIAGLAIYISLQAVGLDLPLTAGILVLTATVFAVMLPAAPGFFGAIQLAFILTLKPYGVSEDMAFAASVYYHVLTYSAVTLFGFYLIKHLGYTLSRLQDDTESSMQAAAQSKSSNNE